MPSIEVVDCGDLYGEVAVLEHTEGHPAEKRGGAREKATEIYRPMDAPRRIARMLQRQRIPLARQTEVGPLFPG